MTQVVEIESLFLIGMRMNSQSCERCHSEGASTSGVLGGVRPDRALPTSSIGSRGAAEYRGSLKLNVHHSRTVDALSSQHLPFSKSLLLRKTRPDGVVALS